MTKFLDKLIERCTKLTLWFGLPASYLGYIALTNSNNKKKLFEGEGIKPYLILASSYATGVALDYIFELEKNILVKVLSTFLLFPIEGALIGYMVGNLSPLFTKLKYKFKNITTGKQIAEQFIDICESYNKQKQVEIKYAKIGAACGVLTAVGIWTAKYLLENKSVGQAK